MAVGKKGAWNPLEVGDEWMYHAPKDSKSVGFSQKFCFQETRWTKAGEKSGSLGRIFGTRALSSFDTNITNFTPESSTPKLMAVGNPDSRKHVSCTDPASTRDPATVTGLCGFPAKMEDFSQSHCWFWPGGMVKNQCTKLYCLVNWQFANLNIWP